MSTPLPLSAARWQAILTNDRREDQLFFYAVKSTHIFCKPSCASRPPKKANVTIFRDAQSALDAGYRPCKRCQPLGQDVPLANWVNDIKNYLHLNYKRHLNLAIIANDMHSSPYYLHHVFKQQTSLTPLSYLTNIRIEKAKKLLTDTSYSIAIIGKTIGIKNASYFSLIFKKTTGRTPSEYRKNSHLEKT